MTQSRKFLPSKSGHLYTQMYLDKLQIGFTLYSSRQKHAQKCKRTWQFHVLLSSCRYGRQHLGSYQANISSTLRMPRAGSSTVTVPPFTLSAPSTFSSRSHWLAEEIFSSPEPIVAVCAWSL